MNTDILVWLTTTGFWLGLITMWLVFSYVVIGGLEYFGHAVLMHKPTWLSRRFDYFKETLDQHRTFHHGICFPGRRFDEGAEEECMVLNIDLKPLTGLMASVWIWAPLLWFYPVGGVVFMITVVSHHAAWGLIHRQMHTPLRERARWFQRSRLFLWMARYHCMHHIYPKTNHSIIFILWDYLLGSYKAPSQKDVETMQKLGLYLQQPPVVSTEQSDNLPEEAS